MFIVVRYLRGKQRKHGRQAYVRAERVSGEKDAMCQYFDASRVQGECVSTAAAASLG